MLHFYKTKEVFVEKTHPSRLVQGPAPLLLNAKTIPESVVRQRRLISMTFSLIASSTYTLRGTSHKEIPKKLFFITIISRGNYSVDREPGIVYFISGPK